MLKNCPKCEWKPKAKKIGVFHKSVCIYCPKCGYTLTLSIIDGFGKSLDTAVKLWNTT